MSAETTLSCPFCRNKIIVPHAKLTWAIVCPSCSRRSHLPSAARGLGMATTMAIVFVGVLVIQLFGLAQPESLGQVVALIVTVSLSGLLGGRAGLSVFRSQATHLVK